MAEWGFKAECQFLSKFEYLQANNYWKSILEGSVEQVDLHLNASSVHRIL